MPEASTLPCRFMRSESGTSLLVSNRNIFDLQSGINGPLSNAARFLLIQKSRRLLEESRQRLSVDECCRDSPQRTVTTPLVVLACRVAGSLDSPRDDPWLSAVLALLSCCCRSGVAGCLLLLFPRFSVHVTHCLTVASCPRMLEFGNLIAFCLLFFRFVAKAVYRDT